MNEQIGLIHLLLSRLERISADSLWAHHASGIRGALLGILENLEGGLPVQKAEVKRLMDQGFKILNQAAKERVR